VTHRSQVQLLLHGAIVLFVGLLCGIPFALAAGNAWGEEAVRAWRVAHTGGAAVGLMLIVIGAVLHRLLLGDRAGAILVWSLVASAYSFTAGVLVAATAGVRGLQAGGPAPDDQYALGHGTLNSHSVFALRGRHSNSR